MEYSTNFFLFLKPSLKKLNGNYEKCFKMVHEISRRWARYRISLKGRITIAKTFLFPQFIYVASVMEPNDSTYETINKMIGSFINAYSWERKLDSPGHPLRLQMGWRVEFHRCPEFL